MSPVVVKRPQVERDLEELSFHIAQDSPTAGMRLLDSAEQTFQQLARIPELGSRWETDNPHLEDVRVWRVRGFKHHLIFYRQVEGGIEVIRVLHGARDLETVLGP